MTNSKCNPTCYLKNQSNMHQIFLKTTLLLNTKNKLTRCLVVTWNFQIVLFFIYKKNLFLWFWLQLNFDNLNFKGMSFPSRFELFKLRLFNPTSGLQIYLQSRLCFKREWWEYPHIYIGVLCGPVPCLFKTQCVCCLLQSDSRGGRTSPFCPAVYTSRRVPKLPIAL